MIANYRFAFSPSCISGQHLKDHERMLFFGGVGVGGGGVLIFFSRKGGGADSSILFAPSVICFSGRGRHLTHFRCLKDFGKVRNSSVACRRQQIPEVNINRVVYYLRIIPNKSF